MIPITDLTWQSLSWQDQLKHSVRSNTDLAAILGVPAEDIKTPFPINVPLAYLSRIRPGDPKDPLLLQVIAQAGELAPEGKLSPLDEEAFDQGFGMIQKYQGRLLVITTGACAINCRYCFRRHFPYDSHQPSTADWLKVFAHLEQHPDIVEVILSGGDPLMLSDKRLKWILEHLQQIPSVATVRLHTRVPVVLPSRVTPELLNTFNSLRTQVVMVSHINHAQELDTEVISRMKMLRQQGLTLLNQSVLLRGINDSATALTQLSRRLHQGGILPYYLHLMDPVQGAEHFNVDERSGIELIEALRDQLPGYLVPRLVQETPHRGSKTTIAY